MDLSWQQRTGRRRRQRNERGVWFLGWDGRLSNRHCLSHSTAVHRAHRNLLVSNLVMVLQLSHQFFLCATASVVWRYSALLQHRAVWSMWLFAFVTLFFLRTHSILCFSLGAVFDLARSSTLDSAASFTTCEHLKRKASRSRSTCQSCWSGPASVFLRCPWVTLFLSFCLCHIPCRLRTPCMLWLRRSRWGGGHSSACT